MNIERSDPDPEFPLCVRADSAGILDAGSALIVAPTATGKSWIGREVIRRAVASDTDHTHCYLVPFRALAEEMYEGFVQTLDGTGARIRISTGDHRDPIRPEEADLLVATYESFGSLLRNSTFRPGAVVADEVHLIADETRGSYVEGLLARLLASGRLQRMCGLSAIVENGEELADWLGVPLIKGAAEDRPIPLTVEGRLVDDLDGSLLTLVDECAGGAQALVFCGSRGRAEKVAEALADQVAVVMSRDARAELEERAEQIVAEDPLAESVVNLFSSGVAYHHAGLPRPIRMEVERAYRDRLLRVVTCTPTLAAGVNLPAEISVVRDVFRFESVRGRFRTVLLPSGEIVNMLGRAGRPHQSGKGEGIALVESKFRGDESVKAMIAAVERGQGEAVRSRLAESFEGLMRFVLAVIVERGEATMGQVVSAFERTLAHRQNPEAIVLDRPFEDDLMEDIPAYRRVRESKGAIHLTSHRLTPDGVHASVSSSHGTGTYEVTISINGVSCTCPAAAQYYRGQICKHAACAIHDLIFGEDVAEEVRIRAIYNCGHIFSRTLDTGTRLNQSVRILAAWGLIEPSGGAWRATAVGNVAVASGFDLLLVRQVYSHIAKASEANYDTVALWAVEDFYADERQRMRWLAAIRDWIGEVDEKDVDLPEKYRGDFERGRDDLGRVSALYEQTALALGREHMAESARKASQALRYGVKPELVPLMALGFPQLRRARSRYLFDRGIRGLADLAAADPEAISNPRHAPAYLVRDWVQRAAEIQAARQTRAGGRAGDLTADAGGDGDGEFDDLIARFRIDPAAFLPQAAS
jgi:replicative superfamily II helicase